MIHDICVYQDCINEEGRIQETIQKDQSFSLKLSYTIGQTDGLSTEYNFINQGFGLLCSKEFKFSFHSQVFTTFKCLLINMID